MARDCQPGMLKWYFCCLQFRKYYIGSTLCKKHDKNTDEDEFPEKQNPDTNAKENFFHSAFINFWVEVLCHGWQLQNISKRKFCATVDSFNKFPEKNIKKNSFLQLQQLKNSFRPVFLQIVYFLLFLRSQLEPQDINFSVKFSSWYRKIQILCSAVTISVRIKFLKPPSRAMERASSNYAFVRWRHWDEASECS